MTSKVQEAARRLIRDGFAPIPVHNGKHPGRNGWQDSRIAEALVEEHFAGDVNIGILTGSPSGGLICADLDCGEAVKIAGRFLPPTLTSGHGDCLELHWWYVGSDTKPLQYKDTDGKTMLVEVRGDGGHTLVEPSVHPDGDAYRWADSGLTIARDEEVRTGVGKVATAALLSRHLPPHRKEGGGGRHDFALALAGYLLRKNRMEAEDAEAILRAAWDAGGYPTEQDKREAHRDLETAVNSTRERLAQGEAVKGGGELDRMEPGMTKTLARYWGWSSSDNDDSQTPAEGSPNLTDLGNAERFAALHRGEAGYCYPWKQWLTFDGQRWVADEGDGIYLRAKEVVQSLYAEAAETSDEEIRKAIAKHARRCEARSRVEAMTALARGETGMPIRTSELDSYPWLLNCRNGTLDLATAELHPHDPQDLMTKLAPVEFEPGAEAPEWVRFLEQIIPSPEVRAFLQRLIGYALTGSIREHVLPVLHGSGANGKSTFLNTILALLGDYGMQAPPDLLLVKQGSTHPTERADLFGRRMVASVEIEQGRRFNESLVKQLTGGERVKARRLYEDFWEFDPTHTILMAANHKPVVKGTDEAIWRRIKLVPFTVHIPEPDQDKHLPEKLSGELPGILNWALEGCLEWQKHGLGEPAEVTEATKEYRVDMDVLETFISERCVVSEGAWVKFKGLYNSYVEWCEESRESPENKRTFGDRLKERGFPPDNARGNVAIRRGIGLREEVG